jgi:hypothetical protein
MFEKPEKYGIKIITRDWTKYYEMGFPVFEGAGEQRKKIVDAHRLC